MGVDFLNYIGHFTYLFLAFRTSFIGSRCNTLVPVGTVCFKHLTAI